MKTLFINANVVTRDEVLQEACVLCEEGWITYVGRQDQPADEIVDVNGKYLLPGFVDIHCHGGANLEFMDANEEEIRKIADFHLAHGTTTLFATTLSADWQETLCALDAIQRYKNGAKDSTICGVHMEGPWLSPLQSGAQDESRMRKPDADELRELKEKYPIISRVSAAPELENGDVFGKTAKSLGLAVGIAHSDADFNQSKQALENGYTIMTHLYSGMKGVTRKNAFRIGGAVEAGLLLDDFFVEVIADGCHLPIELLQLIYKCKGADKICMITDAIRACGLPNGAMTKIGSLQSGLDVVVEDDVAKLPNRQAFAGSTATADRLYRVMAKAIGKDMVALSKMSSLTPATVMGLTDCGEIAVGKRADLLIVNEQLDVEKVFTTKKN